MTIKDFLIPLLGGVLYALGFPTFFNHNFSFFLGPLLGVGLLLYYFPLPNTSQENISFKKSALALLCMSISYNLTGFYWMSETISVFGQIPAPFNFLLALLFSLIIVPQFWIFLFLCRSLKTYIQSPILYALILTLCEYYVPQQFPAHVGHAWLVFAPYLKLTPIFGASIFSFISYWIVLSVLSRKKRHIDYFCLVTISILLLFNFHAPLKAPSSGPILHARIIQANIGNFLKVVAERGNPNSIYNILTRYYELSVRGTDVSRDLIIWPETAYPHTVDSKKFTAPPQIFSEILRNSSAEIFFGGYDQSEKIKRETPADYETLYNTAFLLGRQGQLKGVYHKHLLIPFGETLPFGPLNAVISKYVNNISYFSRGQSFTTFVTKDNHRFISAICYELLFSQFIRDNLNSSTTSNQERAQLIINLTNDSWYGDTAEPYQHLFLAKWRAMEFQLPIIRSTNTGLTSVFFPDGSESRRITLNSSGVLDIDITLPMAKENPPTFFQKWGLYSLIFLALFLFILQKFGKKFVTLGLKKKSFTKKIV